MNYAEVEASFLEAMKESGLFEGANMPAHINEGRINRIDVVKADGRISLGMCWCVLNEDPIRSWGAYGRHGSTPDKGIPWVYGKDEALSPAQLSAWNAEKEQRRQKLEQENIESQKEVARNCQQLWNSYADCQEHGYLQRKHIHAHGARVVKKGNHAGCLAVPAYGWDALGYFQLWSLQFIDAEKRGDEPDKHFRFGGRKRGCFFPIGFDPEKDQPSLLYIAEGFATATSICEATGVPTVAAFDAGNLKGVAVALRQHFSDCWLTFIADNDDSGAGVKGAREAKDACGKSDIVVIPRNHGEASGFDANDFINTYGPEAFKQFLSGFSELHFFSEVMDAGIKPTTWLVQGMFYLSQHGRTIQLIGDSGLGKTFFSVFLAGSIASGLPFMEKKAEEAEVPGQGIQTVPTSSVQHAVRKGCVVYLSADNPDDVVTRFMAFAKHYGCEKDIRENVIIDEVPRPLNDAKNGEVLISLIKRKLPLMKEKPLLIVVDTFNAYFSGEENSNDDMAAYMNNFAKPACKAFGCDVVTIHHTSKGAVFNAKAKREARGGGEGKGMSDYTYFIDQDKIGENSFLVLDIDKARKGIDRTAFPAYFRWTTEDLSAYLEPPGAAELADEASSSEGVLEFMAPDTIASVKQQAGMVNGEESLSKEERQREDVKSKMCNAVAEFGTGMTISKTKLKEYGEKRLNNSSGDKISRNVLNNLVRGADPGHRAPPGHLMQFCVEQQWVKVDGDLITVVAPELIEQIERLRRYCFPEAEK